MPIYLHAREKSVSVLETVQIDDGMPSEIVLLFLVSMIPPSNPSLVTSL